MGLTVIDAINAERLLALLDRFGEWLLVHFFVPLTLAQFAAALALIAIAAAIRAPLRRTAARLISGGNSDGPVRRIADTLLALVFRSITICSELYLSMR